MSSFPRNSRAALASTAALTLSVATALPAVATVRADSATTGSRTYPSAEIPARVQTPDLLDLGDHWEETGEGSPSDAAAGDDPAIWINPQDGDASLVITSAKEAGIFVHDLSGKIVQHLVPRPAPAGTDRVGRINNVDIVQGVELGGRTRDLVIASDRGFDDLRIYEITPESAGTSAPLVEVTAGDASTLTVTSADELEDSHTAYGLAAYADATGAVQVYVTQEGRTKLVQATLTDAGNGTVGYELTGEITMPSSFPMPNGGTWEVCQDPGELPQFEGLSVDTVNDVLYAGQEDVGLWGISLPLSAESSTRLLDVVKDFGVEDAFDEAEDDCVPTGVDHGVGGGLVEADLEAVDILDAGDLGRFVTVSSQGDSTFPVYRIDGPARVSPLGSFTVPLAGGDGYVEGTDGLTFSRGPVGSAYPEGLLVVHDEPHAPNADGIQVTRFSYLDVRDVRAVVEKFLAAHEGGASTGDIPVTARIPGLDEEGTGGEGPTGPGVLALSVADGGLTLGDARNAGDRLRLRGELPQVSVTDSRAEAAGWSVTGQSSELVSSTSAAVTLGAQTLGWSPFVTAGGATPGAQVTPALSGGNGLAAPAALGSASGEGRRGTSGLAADVTLEAPVDTAAGEYRGAMTLSLFPQD